MSTSSNVSPLRASLGTAQRGRLGPLWPHPRFAEVCASGDWADARPASIDVDEWVVGWSANLERDGLRVPSFRLRMIRGSASRLAA
jgi:Protein of unknown function (DUF2750)